MEMSELEPVTLEIRNLIDGTLVSLVQAGRFFKCTE